MSTLIYNCVQIEVIQTVRYVREPVYEGKTYVYSRHFVHVRGLVNPGSTSYDYQQETTDNVVGGSANPNFSRRGVNKTKDIKQPGGAIGQPGNNANLTDQAIRHLLQQPRRKLLYTCGGNDQTGSPAQIQFTFVGGAQDTQILEAPYRNRAGGGTAAPQYTVDCNNGPFPRIYNVWRLDGPGMFRVEFAVECFVNEAHLYLLKPPLLLCNEYEMQHDIDRDGFTTQTVRGVARFRADVLATLQTRPDDYRKFLCMAVPRGFERQNLRVRARTDGATVDYQYTDKEVSHSLFLMMRPNDPTTPAFVTRIEAFARFSEGSKSLDDKAKALLSIGRQLITGNPAGVLSGGDLIPGLSVSIVVRIWGGPMSRRGDLYRLADWITTAKIPQLLDDVVKFNTTSASYGVDLMGRYVEVEKNIIAAGISSYVSEGAGVSLRELPWLTDEDDVLIREVPEKGIPKVRVATTGNPTALPGFTIGSKQTDMRWPRNLTDQTRGDYTRLCVAAALSAWQDGPDVPPPSPPTFNPKLTPTY
jgi:hypothetical protein